MEEAEDVRQKITGGRMRAAIGLTSDRLTSHVSSIKFIIKHIHNCHADNKTLPGTTGTGGNFLQPRVPHTFTSSN